MPHSPEIETLRAAKEAAAALASTAEQLKARHRTCLRDRKSIATASPSEDEVIANAIAQVDAEAAKLPARLGPTFVRELGGYTEARGSGDSREVTVRPHLPTLGGRGLDFEMLCGLVPDLMKARLAEVVRGSGVRFGLPVVARKARLAELDAEIVDIETRHTELVDAAAEVGITLPLLDTVRQRREDEARRAQRERLLEEERARGGYPVALP